MIESIPLSPAQKIIRETCEQFGINTAQLIGHCAAPNLVDIRQHLAVRLTAELGLSRSVIARLVNRNHTSIMYLLQRAKHGRKGMSRRKRDGGLAANG